MKKIIYALVALVVVIALIVVMLFDSLGKSMSEQYATQLLRTPVKINQFNTDFLNKSINIDFIEVKNPPNFNNKNAFFLNHFFLKVGSFDDDLIVIDELSFDGLEFILEQNKTNINLMQLIDNLNQVQTTLSDGSGSTSSANEKRIKIDKLSVNNIVLKVDTQILKTEIDVPNIFVDNFGGNSGVGISQVGKEITHKILQSLKKTLKKKGIEADKQKIKKTLIRKIGSELGIDNLQEKMDVDNIKDNIGSGYDNVKENVGSSYDNAKEVIKEQFDDKLKDKAKDLFKGLGF